MRKTCLTILFLLLFSVINSVGYVILYPGVEFYNNNLSIGFSNPDGINVSYIEVGEDYVQLGDLNLSMSFSGALEINISEIDDSNVTTKDTSILRFNATKSSGSVTFSFYGNNSLALYDLYRDSSLISSHVGNFSWTYSGWSTHDFDITLTGYRPSCPTGADSSYNVTGQTVNLTWSSVTGADAYIVMRRNDTYPTSRTDSSAYQVQNSSNLYYNTSLTTNAYFSLWCFNSTTNSYSLDSCKLNLPWGAIVIYAVYNESKPSQVISPFGLLITNEDGSETYRDTNVNTSELPLYISKDSIPFGDNTVIVLNASSYKTTRYYFVYAVNNFYNHTLYMSPVVSYTPGEGDNPTSDDDDQVNYTTTRLYRIRVVDDYTYPISGAKINVKRYINTTDKYENVSILLTDGYGEADVYLVPNVNYKILITKEGFEQTGSRDWIPDPVFYGANYPKIFQMEKSEPDETNKTFWDIISFSAEMYDNSTIKVMYSDSYSETTNAQFYTYELFNFSKTLIATNTTTSNSFTFWVTGVNHTRGHRVIMHLNHTTLGYVKQVFLINRLHSTDYRPDIESKTVAVFGDFDLGYVNFFLIFLPMVVLLVIFGPRHAGLGVIGAGLYLGFTSFFLDISDTLLGVGVIITALGFIYIIVKGGWEKI